MTKKNNALKSIAVIPARSGSKGLKDKNIMDLNGHPLMYYTIKAALKSGCFDEVMVSTDSDYYAEIAGNCGAAVPFLRNETTSGDYAGSWDVVREVLFNYKQQDRQFDYVALLQPTSPLRNEQDILGAFDMLKQENIHNVVTVTEVDHPVQQCFRMPEDGSMKEMAESPYSYARRQDLEPYYRENGAVYLVDAKKIMDADYNFYADACHGYVMLREKSIDIDTRMDLEIAKVILKSYT
ncbi:MAG: acylneuraminate cytidylyltransferase family protein [Clostridium sp.]|nr:acylneuraminate cytidylyltransferase family protein [Clostridium sp.]MCM1458783.1 acylneuraminate cytidylyltransferase family protein [Bacteroides sp.]